MRNYLDLLEKVLKEGVREPNRTGVDTLTIPGEMLKFDLREGFPAVTTKQLFYDKGVVGELRGFLEGTTSLKRFQELGCNVWNSNMTDPAWLNNPHFIDAQDPDYMGKIYGYQWRNFGADFENGAQVPGVDQIAVALDEIRKPMPGRRIIVNAWNPAELNQAVLPPCHDQFQLLPHRSTNTLHMTMKQRSCDLFLGIPFNIASYATLLHLFARWAGYTAGTLTMFLADVHIYENHLMQVLEQLHREPLEKPVFEYGMMSADAQQMNIDQLVASLGDITPKLRHYNHHPAIKAPMAR